MEEKISVIVTVYNLENYIIPCLESIAAQDYKNLEVVIINDGSKDNSKALIDDFCAKDSRFIAYHGENQGVSYARNLGLEKATGEYLGFVDGDDLIEPKMYSTLMKLLKENDADIAMCDFYRSSNPIKRDDHQVKVYTRDEIFTSFLEDSMPSYLWNKLYRKETVKDLVFPVGRQFEDMYFCYKAVYNVNKMVVTQDTLYQYNDERITSITHEKIAYRNKLGASEAYRERLIFALEHGIKDFGNLLNRIAKENTDFYRSTKNMHEYQEERLKIKSFLKEYKSLLLKDKRVDLLRKVFIVLISNDLI